MKIVRSKQLSVLAIAVVLAFALVGCVGGRDDPRGLDSNSGPGGGGAAGPAASPANEGLPPDVDHIVNPDRELFDSETLVIAVLFKNLISDSVSAYKRANPGVQIEVIDFSEHYERDGSLDGAQLEIATALMAGAGPVLIDELLLDFRDPRMELFLTDWFPVMNADPNFNEEDWFMNVFHASSREGKLYSFPTAFSYNFVTSNGNIPGLGEAVAEYDAITINELLGLYRDFPTDSSYYVESNFSVIWLYTHFIADYLDIDTGLVDFNDEFVRRIDYARSITEPGKGPYGSGYYGIVPRDVEQFWGESFFFHFADASGGYQRILNYEEPPIFHSMPGADLTYIAGEEGELLMYNWRTYLLNAQASPTQQALAWDFLRFMMEPGDQPVGGVLLQPTNRHLMRHAVERELPTFIEANRLKIDRSPEEAVEDVIAKMTAFGDMPMRNLNTLPGKVSDIIAQALIQFQDGLVSAEQTAANLQNQVELMMMEMGVR